MFRARGCTPEEAADLAQDAAVRAFVHIRRWGVNGNGLDPLLNRIARNLLIDRYRRTTPHIVPLDDAGELHDPTQDPTEEVARRQRTHAVRSAIQGLPARHQAAITYSLNGLTPEEVGRRMGIGRNAADALLHRARRSLKERLQTVGEGMFGFALGIRVRWDRLLRGASLDGNGAMTGLQAGTSVAAMAVVAVIGGLVITLPPGSDGGGSRWTAPAIAVVQSAAHSDPVADVSSAADAMPGSDSSAASGGNSGSFGSVSVGPFSRTPGNGGGSTTTVNGPEDGNGNKLIEGTIKNYGTNEPPSSDPVARTLVDLGERLCGLNRSSCEAW